jgi:hypothetical protein
MIGEPDAGNLHVRFDEGVQETCDLATRLRPTLQRPRSKKLSSLFMIRRGSWCANYVDRT